ncbi:hypothetical protein IFM89_000130 [Coptis chinensis]|uniref:Phytocyanin domain-containing protein n=1 Tax=Coptis chinensis TaxID=261450 RepID=A0A835I2C8_9MAGN|nr:hypothetical protein IFM89_000130 [Coptis chinensis]
MARAMGMYFMVLGMLVISLSLGGKMVEAQQVHHVVGGDRGWDPASDLQSWSSNKIFRVGDNIWFTYSAAQESVTELSSKEEFESCDTRNPIKMYTDGVSKVPLDGEGIRYFISSKPENCRNGLKLHVEVLPKLETQRQPVTSNVRSDLALAAGPTPSGTIRIREVSILLSFVLALVACL